MSTDHVGHQSRQTPYIYPWQPSSSVAAVHRIWYLPIPPPLGGHCLSPLLSMLASSYPPFHLPPNHSYRRLPAAIYLNNEQSPTWSYRPIQFIWPQCLSSSVLYYIPQTTHDFPLTLSTFFKGFKVSSNCITMADSNPTMFKKQACMYVTPTPPNDLLDSSTFVIDFINRKFVHVGFNIRKILMSWYISSRHRGL